MNDFPSYIELDSTDINWENIDGSEDIDVSNSTNHRVNFHFENFSESKQVAKIWFQGDLTRDGSEHFRVHYGSGSNDGNVSEAAVWDDVTNIVSRWGGEDTSSPVSDSTSNANDGTVNGATLDEDAVFDDGFLTDGSSDDVNVGSASSLAISEDLSIIVWLDVQSLGSGDEGVITRWGSSNDWLLFKEKDSNTGGFKWIGDAGVAVGSAASTGKVQLAVTRSHNNYVKIWTDATEQGSATPSGTLGTSDNIKFGEYGGGNINAIFDEIHIYNGAVGGDWLQANYDMSSFGGETLFTLGAEQTGDDGGDTTAPSITIHDPTNTTHASSTLDLNVTADESVDVWQYSTDGGSNTTFTPNTTISGLSDGSHEVRVYANDTSGNNGSAVRHFTVDTTAPTVSYNADSTDSGTYSQSWINVDFSGSDSVDGALNLIEQFDGSNTTSADDQDNTYSDNHTGLSDGTYTYTAFAEDDAGNTGIDLTSLDHTFTLELGEQGESVFKLTNTGPETAYDIRLSGKNLSFEQTDGFNLSAGEELLVPFSVVIPRPQTNPEQATNTTYQPTIQVTGRNINDTTLPVNVTVPYQNFTAIEEDEQDIGGLLEKFKEFCETNNCSAVRETVYRNRTVYINRTPVYDANLTKEQMHVLANLTEVQTENWEAVRDQQQLLKQSMNTRLDNVSTELNELEQRNERETRQLRRAIKSLNQTVAKEQRLESQRQQDSSRLGWAIAILVAVLLVIAAIYYVVTRHMGEDWRLIPQ